MTEATPSGELTVFGPALWVADGPLVKDMGLWFPTRMIAARLHDGGVWVCDPIPATDNLLAGIDELGPVTDLVAITQRHIWRLADWHERYPKARLWTTGHIPKALQRLPFSGVLGDDPVWSADFEQCRFGGNKLLAEMTFCHKPSKTLIVGDLIQNNPPLAGHGWTNLVFKLSGAAWPDGGVGFDLKRTFTDKAEAKRCLATILEWDFDKVVIAHGPNVTSDAKHYLEQAFAWL